LFFNLFFTIFGRSHEDSFPENQSMKIMSYSPLLNRNFNSIITNAKYVLVILILLISANTFAQIGIGTKNPAASAALEVTSSTNNKGILIPRITATQKDAIASPAQGLLVYQTTAPIGFYYYTGNSWKLMAIQTDIAGKVDKVDGKDLSTNDYTTAEKTKLAAITGTNTGDQTTITGNAGTATKLATARNINGVAFDGSADITVTADAGTLTGSFTKDITVNSVNIGRGNGENGSNTRIGGQALNSNTLGYQNVAIGDASLSKNTTGGRNNAIGTNALLKNTTGSENTAIGTFALENNTNGNRNLAIGQQALFTNTEGIKNVALGYVPLYSNTTGSNNNAIGDETLFYNTTGNYNIGIGSQAGLTISTGSQNTMIGAQADVASGAGALTNATALGFGAKVSASNTIQLGNTSVTNVKTSGTITAGTVTYPNTHGSTNQLLSTTGSGTLAWTTAPVGLPTLNNTPGDMLYWNGTAWVKVAAGTSLPGNQAQTLVFCNGVPTWGTCPAVVPSAPGIGTATAGNARAIVAFTAPSNNGGAAITSYTVTSSPGGITATGTSSPIIITGLTGGTPYTFTVTATNSAGTGAASVASTSVTPIIILSVTNPTTGKVWMDRNLGATQVATSSTDANSYGDLYQWGRGADGHQLRTSATTNTLTSSNQPGNSNFIINNSGDNDWRSPKNDNLWQGVDGINNPCPNEYRLPTNAELEAERLTWGGQNAAGAFASPLKLPMAGLRGYSNGLVDEVGVNGNYWSSTIAATIASSALRFSTSNLFGGLVKARAFGYSVRCIKD
jgi:hypothetical protein